MHAHSYDHHRVTDIKKLRLALLVTSGLLLVELIGGFVAHSLALMTDAAHMLTDVGAAALGLWAAILAQRAPDRDKTFGYGRATVLAALTNAAALFAIVVFIAIEAIVRLRNPTPVDSSLMLGVALLALIANLVLSAFLSRGSEASLNVKGVNAHVLGDAAISAGVVIAALVISFTHLSIVDPIASLMASVGVAFAAWNLVRDTINILMEAVPDGIDIGCLEGAVREIEQIEDVHDFHVWSLSDRKIAASLHVRIRSALLSEGPNIVAHVKSALHKRFGVDHATIEIECEDCDAAC